MKIDIATKLCFCAVLYIVSINVYSQISGRSGDPAIYRQDDFIVCVPDSMSLDSASVIASNKWLIQPSMWGINFLGQGISLASSPDGEFKVFLYAPEKPDKRYFVEDNTIVEKNIPTESNYNRLWNIIDNDINEYLGRPSKLRGGVVVGSPSKRLPDPLTHEECRHFVTYLPNDYAKEKFNADSAFVYPFWIKRARINFEDKFSKCRALALQKKDKGCAILYVFYTEQVKGQINDFMKEIEGIIYFKD